MFQPIFLLLNILVFTFIFIVGINIMKNWYHVIMVLILMEMLMLQAFFYMSYSSFFLYSLNSVFVFSTLMVIEACLGMSMLANISRSHGDELMMIF